MTSFIKKEIWGRHQMMLFGALSFVIVLLGAIYIYFLSVIVMETVARNQKFQTIQILREKSDNIEKKYLELLSKINLDYAYSLGFVDVNSLVSVERQTAVAQNVNYDQALR